MATSALETIGVRYLTPQDTRLFVGRLGSLHCTLDDKDAFANVYCLLCFSISHPTKYIAVNYTDDENKEKQIGIIEDLDAFSEETRALVKASLGRQYFERAITRIHSVKWEFGLLFFDVTLENNERKDFMMRWQQDKAMEYGTNGKVLLDVFENRFIIESVEMLPAADKDRLMRFIYW